MTKAYEERIKYEREEMQNDFKERIGAIQKEKDHLEEKYDKKRRDYKELEAQTTKDKNILERDSAVEQEKLKNQIYKSEQEAKSALDEVTRLREDNEALKMNLAGDKSVLQEQFDMMRDKYERLDNDFSELQNKYEREHELKDNKIKFTEQQKDTAKKENEEAQRNFQLTLESM
jgi:predicted nuclease with TOPRIM domain